MLSILPFIDTCVMDVFATMVSLQAVPGSGEEFAARPSKHEGVTGSISLTGKFSGVVYANFSESFARAVASRILDNPGVTESEMGDVVGEITNMISGNLKSQLCDRGLNCVLSIPTVMRAEGIMIDAKDAPRLIRNHYRFEEMNEELTVQVFARIAE